MRTLICTSCGAQLTVKEGCNIAHCEYCGTKLVMDEPVRTARSADGLTDIGNEKGVYFRCYLPDGWTGKAFEDMSAFSIACPIRAGMLIASPDGKGEIVFRSAAQWRHFDRGNRMYQQNQPAPDGSVRYRSYLPAAAYCDALLSEYFPKAENTRFIQQLPLSDKRKRELDAYRANTMRQISAVSPNAKFDAEIEGRVYSFSSEGRNICAAITVMVDFCQRGAGGLLGQFIKPAMDWECLYEFVLSAPSERFDACYKEYCKMDGTVQEGAYLQQLRRMAAQKIQQTRSYLSNVQMQMAQDRAAANANMSRMQQDKANYINGVQQDMFRSTSAANDRVAAMQSEAIRGVNSFHTSDGRVAEASTSWNHVYQSNTNPDSFAASSGTTIDSADFDELKKRY